MGRVFASGDQQWVVNSSYAIVVLSKPFLAERKWTEHELNGLFAREKVGRFIILPIWHGIEHEDSVNYDPALADRLAKVSATDGVLTSFEARAGIGQGARRHPAGTGDQANLAQAQERGAEERELVAYAWYEQKGPMPSANRFIFGNPASCAAGLP